MTETLSTGIDILDRKIDGGIPSGQVIMLSASPASQSELFLYEMATVRPTQYLTTERTVSDVTDSLRRLGVSLETVSVHRPTSADPLAEAMELVSELPEESTLIVDPVQRLEAADPADYRRFMNELKARTVETGSLALLHCLDGRRTPPQRDRTEYFSDIVFDLSTRRRGGSVENTLAIPKFRGGQSLPEAIDLDLTADVTIDVSRKIA